MFITERVSLLVLMLLFGPHSCIMVLFQEELDVRVFTGRELCVKACLCVHVLGWVHSFSIWPVCQSRLNCIVLCVGQQECQCLIMSPSNSHLYSLLFYFWPFNSFMWQNQGCIIASCLWPRASTASGWGKLKHQGMNMATVLVKHLLFSLLSNKAYSFTLFTHLCSSTSHILNPFWVQTLLECYLNFHKIASKNKKNF